MKLEIFSNFNFSNSLDKLLNQEMPARIAYKLKTIKNAINVEFAKYEELRQDLLKQYAEKDDQNNLKFQPETNFAIFVGGNEKLFGNRLKELQQVEFQLPSKIKLADVEKLNLTGQDLINLGDLIEE